MKKLRTEIVRERALGRLRSIEDLKLRVPAMQKSELAALAEIGALNFIGVRGRLANKPCHRREMRSGKSNARRGAAGPLLEQGIETGAQTIGNAIAIGTDSTRHSPLAAHDRGRKAGRRFSRHGNDGGPHPMAYHRAEMKRQGIRSAIELPIFPMALACASPAGVIARQRPGTAKGFVFLSMEDETGIANAIITPQLFEQNHVVVVHQQFLLIEGKLQNQENVVSVKAESHAPADHHPRRNHFARFSLAPISTNRFAPMDQLAGRERVVRRDVVLVRDRGVEDLASRARKGRPSAAPAGASARAGGRCRSSPRSATPNG